MKYIDKEEFVPILVKYCNSEQLTIQESIEGFMLGTCTLKDGRHPSLSCLFELNDTWEEYIRDNFNQHCINYEVI